MIPYGGARWAPTVAAALVGRIEPRWRHITAVANVAAEVAGLLDVVERPLLVESAWLHDIGYAPELYDTGSHAIDGARYLRSIGAPARLCAIVANHTHAWVEAEARGLADDLEAEFPREDSPVADALTYADLSAGPTGERMTARARLAEILDRYGVDHVVHQSITIAQPGLLAAAGRVEQLLARR